MERGDDDFMVDADYSIRELEREAERNGYSLSVDLDFREMKRDDICRKMTPEEWEKEGSCQDYQRIQDGT
jgi:hypothetical protein